MSTSTTATDDAAITARSVVTLVVFFVVNLLVIFPVRVRLPDTLARWVVRARAKVLGYEHEYDGCEPGGEDDDECGESLGREERGRVRRVSIPGEHGHESAEIGRQSVVDGDDLGREVSRMSGARESRASRTPSRPSQHASRARPRAVYVSLGLATAPVAGVLLLLASTCIPGSVVRRGIVGSHGLRPYDVMTLFLSFAYISLSLDATGLLRFLAFWVAGRASSSGRLLFSALYALFTVLSLAVGNDPVVLSGTPFVAYFTTHARTPPLPFLFAQFQAANLGSALLVSSNPTNLVLTASFGLSFLSFSAWTALPTVAAALVLYPTLLATFRNRLPRKLTPPIVDPRSALTDPAGAAFTSVLFAVTIVALVALSAAGKLEGTEGVWTVTAPAGLLVLIRDCLWDLYGGRRGVQLEAIKGSELESGKGSELEGGRSDIQAADADPEGESSPTKADRDRLDDKRHGLLATQPTTEATPSPSTAVYPSSPPSTTVYPPSPPSTTTACSSSPSLARVSPRPRLPRPTSTPHNPSPPHTHTPSHTHPLTTLRHRLPTVTSIVTRLPLPLLPFAFSMFILVDALDHVGWLRLWSGWWAAYARAAGAGGCIVMMAILSVLGCNMFGTNIGTTVLLSRVLVRWIEAHAPTRRAVMGSVLALAVGSNFGAYSFTFSASLAGLLWRTILAHKGLHVRAGEFLRWNAVPLVVTMAVACAVVAGEVCVMFRDGER